MRWGKHVFLCFIGRSLGHNGRFSRDYSERNWSVFTIERPVVMSDRGVCLA